MVAFLRVTGFNTSNVVFVCRWIHKKNVHVGRTGFED